MHRRFTVALRMGVLIVLLAGSFLQFQPAKAGIVAGYSEYFLPGSTDQLFAILTDNDSGISGTTLHNVITISIATDNVKIYYDHWENGYGSGVTGNDETYTTNRGTVLTFVSDVPGAGHSGMDACAASSFPAGGTGGSATHCYDGKDRIYVVGGAVSVAQAFWPTTNGTVYANAWEVYPVKPYQQQYTIPVGENLYQFGGSATNYPDFETAYLLIQATTDGTILNVDNKNPSPSRAAANDIVNLSMSKGQVTQVYDIWAGTTINASQPVQVQFIVGNQNAGFDSRSHTAVPTGLWDTKYYSPVPSYGATNVNLYVFNPTASSLIINYEDTSGSGSFTLPANSTRSYREMAGRYVPAGSGVYLAAADGTTKFWAIGEYDTGNTARNWGFSLIPAKTLTTEYIVSWAPGTSDPSPTSNGSPIYISPTQNNTTVFVDYSPANGVADATFTLNRLQVQKVRDPDHVNTGMRIWATAPFTIVWGEDAEFAGPGNPYIDAGYTILPLNQEWVDVVLSLDKTSNPTSIDAAIGQVVSFTLAVDSTYPMSAVDLIDDLPTGWAYVNDSTTITLPDGTTISGASANPTIGGQTLTWTNVGNSVGKPGMNAGETLTLTFQAQTTALPVNYSINSGTVTATSAGEIFTATDTATVVATAPDLTVIKTNNLSGNALVGSPFSWSLDVANGSSSGLATFADGQTILTDNLPPGAVYGAVTVTNGAIPPSGPLACSIAGIVLTCTANGGAVTFPTGSSFSLFFNVTPSAAGALNNPTGGICAVDPNNVVDEDTNEGNNSCSNNVTVATSALSVVKNSSAAGTVNFGDTITYTIEIQNIGGSLHNNVVVNDELPAGTTFVSGTVDGYRLNSYVYSDIFSAGTAYNQSNGATDWSGQSWTETGDNGSSASGTIYISDANNRLQLDAATGDSIERVIPGDLSGKTVTLVVDYRQVGTWEGTDIFYVDVWNGTAWQNIVSRSGNFGDPGAESYDISAHANANTKVRFLSTANASGENAHVTLARVNYDDLVSVTGAAINPPPGVIRSSDNYDLPAGQTMTLTYRVTVDNLSVGQTSVVNAASVRSDDQPQPLTATTTDNLPNSTISGQVRRDVDRDGTTGGIADAGDSGLAGATVTLYTDPNQDGDPADGVQVGSPISTDVTGNFSFGNIPTGYYVLVETDPANYTSVMDKDGDTTSPGYNRIPLALLAGENNTGNNYLDLSSFGALSGSILIDTNNDNTGDAPLPNVTLTLFTDPNADGDPTDGAAVAFDVDPRTAGLQSSVLSQADGTFSFANVPAGSYVIVETQPAGYLDADQADITADSPLNPADAGPTTNRIPVNLAAGETDDGNRFVEEQPGTLTGHVYYDRNADGSQDLNGLNNIPGDADDEVNLGNVSVLITPSSGAPFTVSTNASGDWTASVPPGSTTINVDETDTDFTGVVPAGFSHTEGIDPQTVAAAAGVTTSTGNDGYGEYRPTANDDNPADIAEDSGTTNIPVLVNDNFGTDGPSTGTIIIATGAGAAGTATVNDGGTANDPTDDTIDFTPTANYNGPVSITYRICDADGDCDPAVVSFNVTPVDDAPVANNDALTTPEDTTLNSDLKPNNGTAADVASGDGGNIWSKLTDPAHGTVTVNADGTFSYVPTADYNGSDSFTYQICDVDNDCDPATVTIAINPVDDTPVANNDTNTTSEDTPVSGSVTGNDTLSGDGGNSWNKLTDPGNGTLVFNADGTYTYTPNAEYNGTDSFTYRICDVDGDCDPATVTITINPVDDAPVANNDTVTTGEDSPVTGSVAGNDNLSGDGGNTFNKLTNPTHGTLVFNPDGTYTYTPNSNWNGTDIFTYEICDADGDCDPATVNITVNPADDPVNADNESYATPEDTLLTVNAASGILPGDSYPDGFGTVTVTTDVSHGTLTLNTSDGSFTYLPDVNYTGNDSFEYELCDVDGDCATGTVDITVDPVDEAPTAGDDSATTNQDTPVTINQVSNDNYGGDGAHGTTPVILPDGLNGLLLPSHGSVSLNDNGTPLDPGDDRIVYTPSAGYYGADRFEYRICDVDGDCDPATVTISIQGNPGGLSKALVDSNQTATTNPDVAIGEIVTYQVSVNVPPGVFASAQLVDTMDRGISFMDCVGITDNGLQTSQPSGFASICLNPVIDDAGGTTTVDVGRRVTFDFGTLTNNTGADQTLLITYRAVVLDSAGNLSGTSLDNSAEWTWTGGTLGPVSETLVVVEPDLSILTTANTTLASLGSEITITLTIQHTTDSETNAYDAVVTDTLPAGLQYVPGSLECTSGAQDADVLCAEAGGTITAQWSNFIHGGGNGQVTFRVTVLSLPAGGITNTANVAWTSLPGNVGVPQNSNVFSTERDYDPGSPINIYGNNYSLTLGAPADGGNGNDKGSSRPKRLPATGFAPNKVTDLSNVAREIYASTGGVTIEIPSLGVNIPVVGVPFENGTWNVNWLGKQAGWLEGSAFPSWNGNSILTSHVYLSNGLPGPFVNLNKLTYGEKILIHASGQKYTFEVQSNKIVEPGDTSAFTHEEKAWLTLVTCKEYDEKTNNYRKRVVIRAVLVSVTAE